MKERGYLNYLLIIILSKNITGLGGLWRVVEVLEGRKMGGGGGGEGGEGSEGGGVMRWRLVGGGEEEGGGGGRELEEKERVCWVRGLELWKVFFLFCFFLGGEEGLGGRALEKRLRVGWVM